MASSNEEQIKSSKPADKLPQPGKATIKHSTATVSPSKSFLWWLPGLTIVIAIVALIVALYDIYANKQSYVQSTQHLNLAIDQLKQQQSATQNGLDTIRAASNQSQSSTQNQVQVIKNDLRSVMQQRLYQKQDWLLLKARHYLELAQINAHWSDDQQTTIALLQQADNLVRTISDQQLFKVRQAIAQEIAQLQALPKIDTAGLLSQLDAAENTIANLPIKHPLQRAPINNVNNDSWRQKLRDSMNVLEKLVVVRHNDEDIQPLLSPLHQTLERDSIRINLQEAEWALLQNNPKIYQLSIAQALNEINRAFDENATITQALIKQLQGLQQEKLETVKPTIDQSLLLLNQLIESKNAEDPSALKEGDKTQ